MGPIGGVGEGEREECPSRQWRHPLVAIASDDKQCQAHIEQRLKFKLYLVPALFPSPTRTMAHVQRIPPLSANLGQACYKCFAEKPGISKCSACKRIGYCSSGAFQAVPTFLKAADDDDQRGLACQKVIFTRYML